MENYLEKDYKVFELFHKQWAVVSAGTIDDFNCCTIGWGALGTLWTRPNCPAGQSLTVYVHPGRYTCKYLKENDLFTVSFFDEEYRKAVAYIGSHSGKNENKVANAGLTAEKVKDSVGFKEASFTFVCRKVYQHKMAKEDIAKDVQEYYQSRPQAYPVDENGQWQPHYVFVGEILEVIDHTRK